MSDEYRCCVHESRHAPTIHKWRDIVTMVSETDIIKLQAELDIDFDKYWSQSKVP